MPKTKYSVIDFTSVLLINIFHNCMGEFHLKNSLAHLHKAPFPYIHWSIESPRAQFRAANFALWESWPSLAWQEGLKFLLTMQVASHDLSIHDVKRKWP